MKVVFRSGRSLCSMLAKVKDTLAMEVVHWIPCTRGRAYIGETVKRLET